MCRRVALAFALLCACRPPRTSEPPQTPIERRTSELADAVGAEGFTVDLERLHIEQVAGAAWVEHVSAEFDHSHDATYWKAMAALRRALASEPAAAAGETVRREIARARAGARAAVYDAERATIFVSADAVDDPWLDRDLVRALAHAYQDQRIAHASTTSTDTTAVRTCLLDGHADVLAFAIVVGRPLHAVDDAWFGPIGTPVAGEVEVTCAAGGRVLATQAREGGWPAALRVIEAPPVSTEQLLHPEKRGTDEPTAVALPPWPPAAGPATLLVDDTLGELAIARLLRERGMRPAQAWRAAIGWDGDRLQVFTLRTGAAAIVWRSVWDREKDARQFARAIAGGRLQIARVGRVVDAIACDDEPVRRVVAAALVNEPMRLDGAPSDEQSARAAERAGVPVD